MKLFMGRWTHTLDAKNRVSVPRKVQDVLRELGAGNAVVLTKGLDGCLYLYTEDEFARMADTLEAGPQGDAENREFARSFYTSAQGCTVDKAGRLLLPEELKQTAALTDKVLFAGVGRRVELWNPEAFAERQANADKNYESNAQKVLR